jgi:hypothetical protein
VGAVGALVGAPPQATSNITVKARNGIYRIITTPSTSFRKNLFNFTDGVVWMGCLAFQAAYLKIKL